jgi:hypothetical protein
MKTLSQHRNEPKYKKSGTRETSNMKALFSEARTFDVMMLDLAVLIHESV